MKLDHDVYVKEGRRYRKISQSTAWRGFPMEGIWIVQKLPNCESSTCICRLSELPELDVATLAKLSVRRQKAEEALLEACNKPISISNMVAVVIKALSEESR